MALQIAAGRPPSISPDQLRTVRNDLTQLEGDFDASLLDYPQLISRDGRQDFLHFFLYPLIVAPAVPFVSAIGLHPNWAFTLTNALLLALALFVVARHSPLIVCVAMFLAPIIWWVDKAHTEAFLYATVVIAAALFDKKPAVALIAFALAGAQNAAIGLTYPFFVFLSYLANRSRLTMRTWAAACVGGAIVAAPFVYTWIRLQRLSPMAEYAQPAFPSIAGVAAFLLEPNIGLMPHAPVYIVALLGAGMLAVIAWRKPSSLQPLWWWPAIIQLLLLVAWTQNPNANHGGTPGINRWVLSLLALSVPWLVSAHRMLPHSGRVTMNLVTAISAVMSAAAHLPAQPENYREPTRLAERMWRAGWLYVTPAEVFAERTQGREPAFAPSHDGTCRVLLIADQQAPVQCAPPREPLPAHCRRPQAMCYAVVDEDTAYYMRAPQNGFFYRVAELSWPAGGPLAAGVHRVLHDANPTARVWRVDNSRRWRERFAGAEIGAVLSTPEAVFIHVPRLSDEARRIIAADQTVRLVPLMASSEAGVELTNLAIVISRRGGG